MANDDDWQNWMGAQIPFIGFDQLEQFSDKQFTAMLASNRDASGILTPYIRATCQPKPKSWLSRFLQWWWDPTTGYPIMERSGVVRWFVRIGDVMKWAASRQELKDAYPHTEPKSVAFIPAFVTDNKKLMESDPAYLANLMAQGLVEQEQWIKGNWKIEATAGTIFNRAWFAGKIIQTMPTEIEVTGRYWDLAHTAEAEGKDPDWTCSVKGMKFSRNKFLVTGFTRWRRTSFETEQGVKATAEADGIETQIGMEREPAAGKSYCAYYQREILSGFRFACGKDGEPGIPSIKSKVVRAGPLSSAVQAGNVFLLEGSWNSEFIDHLEAFRGDEEKNDVPDAAGGCYNMIFNETSSGIGAGDMAVGDYHSARTFTARALFYK